MLRKAIVLAILGILLISTAIYASYEWQFPITVTDTSNTAHTYYAIDLGFGTDALVTAGKLDANGLDSNLQEGATSLAFMNATSRVMGVLPSLPALEGRTYDYYTGFAPVQTATEIVVGQDGYVTTLDNADLEPADSFELTLDLYIKEATYTIFDKLNVLRADYNSTTDVLTITIGTFAAPDYVLTANGITSGEHVIVIKTTPVFTGGLSNTTLALSSGDNDVGIYDSIFQSANNYLRVGTGGWGEIYESQVRYTNVAIPNGATISKVLLTWEQGFSGGGYGSLEAKVHCEDANNSTISTDAVDFAGRTLTTSYAFWNPSYGSPDISYTTSIQSELIAVIQEVVNRVGWVSGNALSLFFKRSNADFRLHNMYSFEGGGVDSPSLYIEFGASAISSTKVELYVDDLVTPTDSDTLTSPLVDNANDWVWHPDPYFNYIMIATSN